ncbi:MAG: hypothetical protein FWC40_03840 [Proteobacteria bacterium]|nr:hypothetical protein [Pseudomonadota bacterium]
MDNDNILIIKKYGLIYENGAWYSNKENSHKHLIVKEVFLQKTDTIGLLFRINKLCMAKVKYFRTNIDKYEPCKYHYKNGFVVVPLWDADFLKHRASGFILDFCFLKSITVYENFLALCKELESYES